ncbi:hypothetical protein SteCoe_7812 [Stentor coeruleus]|uniref:RING-CH-type domain-containing protein n=1 Tax=Stentor coeruleus TaxID=5963 RepID=A0A1R2CLN3_9CILI|nr:hypothetical protein SteCoe_7812 [Stentor coeruleus]
MNALHIKIYPSEPRERPDNGKSIQKPYSLKYTTDFLISKKGTALVCVQANEKEKLGKNDRLIATVSLNEGIYMMKILKSMLNSYSDTFWMVINSSSISSYQLSQGDIIKVGSSHFRVNRMKGFHSSKQLEKQSIKASFISKGGLGKTFQDIPIDLSNSSYTELFCRVCRETEDSFDDPFISPCACSGTMGYMHYRCFSEWVLSKLHVEKLEFHQIITWDGIICESCRTEIPDNFKSNDKRYSLLSLLKPHGKYISLELSRTVTKIQRKIIIISLQQRDYFCLGIKGEILPDDLNKACTFQVQGKKILLQNESLCMDTMVMARKTIEMPLYTNCLFANGGNLISFNVKEKMSIRKFFCFCRKRTQSS